MKHILFSIISFFFFGCATTFKSSNGENGKPGENGKTSTLDEKGKDGEDGKNGEDKSKVIGIKL